MNFPNCAPLAIAAFAFVVGWSSARANSDKLPPASTAARVPLSLTINPDYSPERLPPEVRTWHTRLWEAIKNPNPGETYISRNEMNTSNGSRELASSNNTYVYGRSLSNYVTALLRVFRATGEKALLDEVERIATLMRGQLEDWSILAFNGATYEQDGYPNWPATRTALMKNRTPLSVQE